MKVTCSEPFKFIIDCSQDKDSIYMESSKCRGFCNNAYVQYEHQKSRMGNE